MLRLTDFERILTIMQKNDPCSKSNPWWVGWEKVKNSNQKLRGGAYPQIFDDLLNVEDSKEPSFSCYPENEKLLYIIGLEKA